MKSTSTKSKENKFAMRAKVFFRSPARITLFIAGIFFIISFVELLTGATDISSPGTS